MSYESNVLVPLTISRIVWLENMKAHIVSIVYNFVHFCVEIEQNTLIVRIEMINISVSVYFRCK